MENENRETQNWLRRRIGSEDEGLVMVQVSFLHMHRKGGISQWRQQEFGEGLVFRLAHVGSSNCTEGPS